MTPKSILQVYGSVSGPKAPLLAAASDRLDAIDHRGTDIHTRRCHNIIIIQVEVVFCEVLAINTVEQATLSHAQEFLMTFSIPLRFDENVSIVKLVCGNVVHLGLEHSHPDFCTAALVVLVEKASFGEVACALFENCEGSRSKAHGTVFSEYSFELGEIVVVFLLAVDQLMVAVTEDSWIAVL